MHIAQVLTLLLALSGALNVASAAGLIARLAGALRPRRSSPRQAPPAPSWQSSSLPSPPTTDEHLCQAAPPPCRPPENGGCLALAAPSPTDLNPGRYRLRIGARRPAQSRGLPCERLVRLTLARAPSRTPATSASRSARPPASSRSAATAAASSSLPSSRHCARRRASPQISAMSSRSACGRLSITYSSIARRWHTAGTTPWPRASPRRAPPAAARARP